MYHIFIFIYIYTIFAVTINNSMHFFCNLYRKRLQIATESKIFQDLNII